MSHVFISYSRKDLIFAKRIVNALKERDLETWLDWENIPKGEKWKEEIYRGIEAADAFLFLISPDSVRSAICNEEILHAMGNNKRILPVLLRETDVKEFDHPDAGQRIASLNWIFCREGVDDFTEAIEAAQETIRTDYDWLRFHTDLQVQSLVWDKSGREASRLLRGKELIETEAKIAYTRPETEPFLTETQQQYMRSSRKAADHLRRRPLRIGGWIAALLAVFFIVYDRTWYRFVNIQPAPPAVNQVSMELPDGEQLADEIAAAIAQTLDMEYVVSTDGPDESEETLSFEFTEPAGDAVGIRIALPLKPAYQLDFLPEIRHFEEESIDPGEAARLVKGAGFYSVGRYQEAIKSLESTTSLSGLTLLAQAYLFDSNFEASRIIYDEAIQQAKVDGKDTTDLHMGAAYAWWIILDVQVRNELDDVQQQACNEAFDHYGLARPSGEIQSAWLTNLMSITSRDEFCKHTSVNDPEPATIILNNNDSAQVDAIGLLVSALNKNPDDTEELKDRFQLLVDAANELNYARYSLSRLYWSYGDSCVDALAMREELKIHMVTIIDRYAYRDLFNKLPLPCTLGNSLRAR